MIPLVYIIVLNWNNAPDTLECLRSIATLDYPNYRLLVVDNGSNDDSVARIRAGFPEVDILETGANLGYAGGNNTGIRKALVDGADYILILNNDVVVEPDCLQSLVAALEADPTIGVCTPLVAERGDARQVWALGSAVDWSSASVTRIHAEEPVEYWQQQSAFEVDAASGAAMLVRRAVFESVGLIDEAFFLYFEEVDWSLLVRKAGYRIVAVPTSLVWHKVSSTLGTTSPVIDYYMLRNHLRLVGRHWSGWRRYYLFTRLALRNLITVAAFTVKSHNGERIANRNARMLALRDALLGRWGKTSCDVLISSRPWH